jgi:hypothetical protein
MPRFVILEHDYPQLHWDFMLESGETLRTWKLAMPPQVGQAVVAESSFDHRMLYLDYEGPISNNRGSVVRWDSGSFIWTQNSEGQVQIELQGKVLKGRVDLIQIAEGKWKFTLG